MRKKIMAVCLSLAMVLEAYTPALADTSNNTAVTSDSITMTSDSASESVTVGQNAPNDTQESSEPSAGMQNNAEYAYEATASGIMYTAESTAQPCPHKTIIIDKSIPATCKTDGLTEGSHCLECGQILVARKPIPASSDAHQWSASEPRREEGTDYVISAKAVCMLCGEESVQTRRIRLGDMNQNDQIELSDVQAVLRYALRIQNMGTSESVLADVNQSSSVDLEDAYLVLKKALRIINNYDDVLVENVTVSQSSATMKIGDALSLTATAYPLNAINNAISWSSSNTAVATVSQNGQVKAIGVGTVTITASAGDHKATCTINIQANSSPYAANCQKLIRYILQNGSTNSNGDKYINQDRNNNRAGIVYEPASNKLRFVFGRQSPLSNSSFNMVISTNGPKTEKIEYALIYNNTYLGCLAYSIFDAETYSDTSEVYFNATTLLNMTESEVQSIANTGMKLAFSSWELLLFSDLRMSMADIGFISYP